MQVEHLVSSRGMSSIERWGPQRKNPRSWPRLASPRGGERQIPKPKFSATRRPLSRSQAPVFVPVHCTNPAPRCNEPHSIRLPSVNGPQQAQWAVLMPPDFGVARFQLTQPTCENDFRLPHRSRFRRCLLLQHPVPLSPQTGRNRDHCGTSGYVKGCRTPAEASCQRCLAWIGRCRTSLRGGNRGPVWRVVSRAMGKVARAVVVRCGALAGFVWPEAPAAPDDGARGVNLRLCAERHGVRDAVPGGRWAERMCCGPRIGGTGEQVFGVMMWRWS